MIHDGGGAKGGGGATKGLWGEMWIYGSDTVSLKMHQMNLSCPTRGGGARL